MTVNDGADSSLTYRGLLAVNFDGDIQAKILRLQRATLPALTAASMPLNDEPFISPIYALSYMRI